MAPKRSHHADTKPQPKAPPSDRRILITAGEGQTGRLVIDLLATDKTYLSKYAKLSALVFSQEAKSILAEYENVEVIVYEPDNEQTLIQAMKAIDTCMLIPPSRKDKAKITRTLIEAAKQAGTVTNLIFLSSAGADYANPQKQPRLHEFIDLEVLAMQPEQDPSSQETGHSTCIIRAGFYAENLLLYTKQAQGEGKLPIPIDENHKFAPVALGDIAQVAAHALTSVGPHGLGDDVRGELLVVTGPMLTAGPELAECASQALGTKMDFQSITESEAKAILSSEQGEEVDAAEKEYLLEYYSLVREGKACYVSNLPMLAFFGQRGQEPSDFFKTYSGEFKPKKRRMTKSGGAHPAPIHAPVKKTSTRGRGAAAKKKAAAAHEDTDGDNDLEDAHGEIVMEGEEGLVEDVGGTVEPGRKTVAKGL